MAVRVFISFVFAYSTSRRRGQSIYYLLCFTPFVFHSSRKNIWPTVGPCSILIVAVISQSIYYVFFMRMRRASVFRVSPPSSPFLFLSLPFSFLFDQFIESVLRSK